MVLFTKHLYVKGAYDFLKFIFFLTFNVVKGASQNDDGSRPKDETR